MRSLLVAASAVLALSVVGMNEASAQHGNCGYGRGGGYSRPGFSISVGYGSGYSGFNSGYSNFGYGRPVYGGGYGGGYSNRVWHDTSHLDYHGPSLIRHNNHYDVVPGHYDLHRTGHWDRIDHGGHGHW